MQNISLHSLKSLSCFTAVTFYSVNQICNDECFLHDNTMSVLYFLSVIAKPLFFAIIGYMDETIGITPGMVLLKIKSIILIFLLWNVLFFFIDSALFQQGYLPQNEILISIAVIYLLHPLLVKVLRNIILTLTLVCVFIFFLLGVNFYNSLEKGYNFIELPQYFNAWILISYYLFGRILGSRPGQRASKKTGIVLLAKVLIIPVAVLVIYYEQYLSVHSYQNIVPWFLLEHFFVLLLCLLLFVLFDNVEIKNPWVVKTVSFISPAMVGVYIVHYSVFYLISTAYDFNDISLRFSLLIMVFLVSVVISRVLLLNRFTSQVVSL